MAFTTGTLVFATAVEGCKVFVCLDRMLHHKTDPTKAVIGSDNRQTRSPCVTTVKAIRVEVFFLNNRRTPIAGKVGLHIMRIVRWIVLKNVIYL